MYEILFIDKDQTVAFLKINMLSVEHNKQPWSCSAVPLTEPPAIASNCLYLNVIGKFISFFYFVHLDYIVKVEITGKIMHQYHFFPTIDVSSLNVKYR